MLVSIAKKEAKPAKALVYLGSDKKAAKAMQERPRPDLTVPTDAIIKITIRQYAAPTFTFPRATSPP
jgi:hypothetical protein